jgi:hypothetical protein
MTLSRRHLVEHAITTGGLLVAVLAAACGGGSYVSSGGSTPAALPTNVVGKSDTSGISAGAALQAPDSTPTPKS